MDGHSTAASARVAPGRILAVSSFGAFLAFLDATVVNVAFPSIRASFSDASVSDLSWVLNAYNITFASFLIVFGRFADLVGRKRLFSLGTLLFTAASVWCAASGSLELLVAARVVQALGAAMLVPASLALVVEAFPTERRSHAVGLWGASAAVAAGLGPPIGGALVQWGDWRWAFLVNLPFGAAALWLNRHHLVESRAPGRRRLPDLRGALVLAAGLSFLTLGIVQGNDWGWSSARVVGSFALAALLVAGFVASSRSHPQPLLDPALLRIRPFAVGNLVTMVAGMGFYAYLLTNILWLQYVWGYSVLEAGLALVPGALVAAVTAAVLGEVAQKHGYRWVIVPGAIVWCAAYLWYAVAVDPTPAFLSQWLPGQVLSGIGVGATLPVLGSASLAAVPGGRFATASAVLSSTRQLGGVLGVSVLVVIIGTPTPATVVDSLPHGWLFCAGCFAACAVGTLLLGDPRRAGPEEEEPAATVVAQVPPVLAPAAEPASYDPIPADVLARLEAAGQMVELKAGEWLFRQGDPAGSMFVVHSGRLEVLVDDELVRELGGGSLVGELALLAGEPTRSASVQARRDSILREVDRSAFERVLVAEPAASLALASGLAVQLRSPSRREESSQEPVVIGVVAAHPGARVPEVLDALRRSLAETLDVGSLGRSEGESLATAEREHDRVLVWADDVDSPEWESCVRQSDRLVVVASTWVDVPAQWHGPAGADLVLVGKVAGAAVIDSWCAVLSPRRVWSVMPGGADDGLRPLVRSLTGQALGVVMAGGGARAMSSIGVLMELEAAGLVVDRVAGCSLGAIVAGCYATGQSAAEVHELAYAEFVRRNPFGDYTLPVTSLSKGQRTAAALRRNLGEGRIEALPREFHCVSTDLLSRSPYVHESGPLWEAVTASARLPVLFPPMHVDGRMLVDGSVLDNLPAWLLTKRREGPVIAVHIGLGGTPRKRSTRPVDSPPGVVVPRPRVPSLGETLLRTMTIAGGGSTDDARAAGAYLVVPPSMGVGLLEFHQLDRMVEAGRLAARELLEATGGVLQPTH